MDNNDKARTKRSYKLKSYDEAFIEIYTDNPKITYKDCIIQAGYEGEYARQEGARIYKRLADKIHEVFTDKIKKLEGMAIKNIQAMLDTDIKEIGATTMLAVSKTALDFAGRKAGDVLTIKQEATIDDLDTANSQLIKKIALEEGKTISQVITELENPQTTTQH
jgi:hypothetical protein